jgi:hypothetical protein
MLALAHKSMDGGRPVSGDIRGICGRNSGSGSNLHSKNFTWGSYVRNLRPQFRIREQSPTDINGGLRLGMFLDREISDSSASNKSPHKDWKFGVLGMIRY